jgi:hypothetical protein
MPIKLVPTEFADLPQIARIENAAFGPSEHSKVLFPGGATNGALEKRVERLQNKWKEDPTLTWWNAVDIESGEIVGAASWHTYFTERPESEWMKEDISEDWGEGANPAACRAFFGDVHESRRRLIGGKPHICTSSYRCSPYPALIASSALHSCHPPGATEARSWVDVDQVGMRSCRRKESAYISGSHPRRLSGVQEARLR